MEAQHMGSYQTYTNPRRLYTTSLMADPRWRGPYLAVALLFGIQTGQQGVGWIFQIGRDAFAVGLQNEDVEMIADALVEQGYIALIDKRGEGEYRLTATGVAVELERTPATAEPEWHNLGPATQWLYRETRAWNQYQMKRDARRRAVSDSDGAQVAEEPA